MSNPYCIALISLVLLLLFVLLAIALYRCCSKSQQRLEKEEQLLIKRNSNQLMGEVDLLKRENSEFVKLTDELGTELSSLQVKHSMLKNEFDKLSNMYRISNRTCYARGLAIEELEGELNICALPCEL